VLNYGSNHFQMIFFCDVTPFSLVDAMKLCNQFTKLHDVIVQKKTVFTSTVTRTLNITLWGQMVGPIKLRQNSPQRYLISYYIIKDISSFVFSLLVGGSYEISSNGHHSFRRTRNRDIHGSSWQVIRVSTHPLALKHGYI